MDRIFEAYNGIGGFSREFMRKSRERLHWTCSQVWGRRVLDVGCSQGIGPILLGRMGYEVLGIDVNPEAIAFAKGELEKESDEVRRRVQFDCADFNRFNKEEWNQVDAIVMGEVLEHLVRPADFINKAFRLLKPSGKLIVTVPFGINDDPDHRQTFYLTNVYTLLFPFFDITGIRFFGSWIGFIAKRREEKTEEQPQIPLSLFRQAEEAFYSVERPLRDEILNAKAAVKKANDAAAAAKTSVGNEVEVVETKVGELTTALEVEKNASRGYQEQIAVLKAMLQFVSGQQKPSEKNTADEQRLLAYSQEARELKDENGALRDANSDLKTKLAVAEVECSHLSKELSKVEATVSAAERKAAEALEMAEMYEAENDEVRSKESSLVKAIETLSAEKQELELAKKELAERYAALEAQREQSQAAIVRIAGERTRLDQELAQLRLKLSKSYSDAEALRSQLANTEAASEEAIKTAETLKRDIARIKETNAALKLEVQQGRNRLEKSVVEYEALSEENKVLKETLIQTKSIADKANADFDACKISAERALNTAVGKAAELEAKNNQFISEHKDQISRKNAEIAAINKSLLQKDGEISNLKDCLVKKEASLKIATEQLNKVVHYWWNEIKAHRRFSKESYLRGIALDHAIASLTKFRKVCSTLDKALRFADVSYNRLAKSKLGRVTIKYWNLKFRPEDSERKIRRSRELRASISAVLDGLMTVKVEKPTVTDFGDVPRPNIPNIQNENEQSKRQDVSSPSEGPEQHIVGLPAISWKSFKVEQLRISKIIEEQLRDSGAVSEANRINNGIKIVEGQLAKGAVENCHGKHKIVSGRLKVATILDTFSDSCFGAECDLVRITPENWREVLEKERPDMLLVESAWNGNGGSWQYLIGTYGGSTRDKLKELLCGCREFGIPTAFWNKEDPPHFDKFIEAASLFDHIFTTDENCVPRYRKMCGHDRVSALPFAAAPTIHNPVVIGPRDRDVCFAGTYYANRFEDRRKQMDVLLECADGFNFDIYDRMFGNKNPGFENYLFPERFRKYIRGKLDYSDMLKAYRRYKFFLNTNSVVDSGTMFSRRVFELLACGTPVITTPSVGIKRFFDGIVDEITSVEDGRKYMSRLLKDKEYYRNLQIKGIREVLSKHTYAIRLEQMARELGFEYKRPTAVIAVFAIPGKDGAVSIVETLKRQSVGAHLVVIRKSDKAIETELRKSGFEVIVADSLNSKEVMEFGVNFTVWMNFHFDYGANYLLDASLCALFENGHLSGMRATEETEFEMADVFVASTVAASSECWSRVSMSMDRCFLDGLNGMVSLHGYNRPKTEITMKDEGSLC